MLKVESFKKGDVVSVKLISGDEIVTKISDVTEDSYAFDRPVTLSITQQGMGLVPFMMTAEISKAFVIGKDKVITMVEPQEAIRGEYVKATTGIITPPSTVDPSGLIS